MHRSTMGVRHAVAFIATALLGNMAGADQSEVDGLMTRLLQVPTIEPAAGYAASMLVAPGALYDPLWLHRHGDEMWFNDDGGEEGEKGSRILALGSDGQLRVVVALGRMLPVTGFDFAPAAFGTDAGQIYSLAQAQVAAPGTTQNHVIQRIDAASEKPGEVVCTLQAAGAGEARASGFGVDARFGPAGSPFADRFFALAAYNNTIYQVNAARECSVFVTFDGALAGAPMGLTFAADGQTMLVTLKPGGFLAPSAPGSGLVIRVYPDGRVDPTPVASGFTLPGGILVTAQGFAGQGPQIYVTDIGDIQSPVPMTQALARDGKVYRVTTDGKPELVASGFVNPLGLEIVDGALWVTDINGDFIAGKRELPDGFVVKLTPR
jgi:hypothetical protein